MRIKVLSIAAMMSAAMLGGCANMADSVSGLAGLGVVTKKQETFDNSIVVQVSPTWLYAKGSWGNKVKLGARWSSAAPDQAALELSYGSDISSGSPAYLGLTKIELNIDGKMSSYAAGSPTNLDSSGYNTVTKTIYTQSTNLIVIPYAALKDMVNARDCRLRIHTSKGYEDAEFSVERIPGGQGTAILSIRKFIAEVDTVAASKG